MLAWLAFVGGGPSQVLNNSPEGIRSGDPTFLISMVLVVLITPVVTCDAVVSPNPDAVMRTRCATKRFQIVNRIFRHGRVESAKILPNRVAGLVVFLMVLTWEALHSGHSAFNTAHPGPGAVVRFAGSIVLAYGILKISTERLVKESALRSNVSLAPVIDISTNSLGQKELVREDGTFECLDELVVFEWPQKGLDGSHVALVLPKEFGGRDVWVTKDGDCYLRP
jgi:hypothetical protein